MIDVKTFQDVNATRARRWHGDAPEAQWSTLEWCGAMAGEVGEACNAAKKLKRVMAQMANHDTRKFGQEQSLSEQLMAYRVQVGKEACDAIIYGFLVCQNLNLDVETLLREVFNKKSEEYGFPERI